MRLALAAASLVVPVVVCGACGGLPDETFERRSSAPPAIVDAGAADTLDPTDAFTAPAVRAYMRQLAPYLVSRELETSELGAIDQGRYGSIRPILEAWTKEPSFSRAARRLYSQKLSVSGSRDGIDFELPGNLAEYLVREGLPLSTLLTADYCVDASGAKTECDSGAPFKAGVLATRAFLASRASRFNLTRASTMLRTFACATYPLVDQLEPRLDRARLIPMFQVDREPEDAGTETFGNGSACYACHGQFGAHAQLFVRFDEIGTYRAQATGLQDPKGELGRSNDGLFASHLSKPEEAREERSQMFGRQVKDLNEAAKVLAESDTFVPCQAKNLLEYALRLPPQSSIARDVIDEIAARAREAGDPTFASLVIETFVHPRIVASVVRGMEGEP